jgi:SWI/SNF-related matrix-associated actin-dependent regulator of chromatin subfamily A3
MIDGSLPLTERIKVLKEFRSPDGANILLMTLGTGAVGRVSFMSIVISFSGPLTICRLNLAVASRIYLLEPQWNPSIESQAIGRALRLGQTAQVVIVRYIMMHTVEEV